MSFVPIASIRAPPLSHDVVSLRRLYVSLLLCRVLHCGFVVSCAFLFFSVLRCFSLSCIWISTIFLALFQKLQLVADLFSLSSVVFFFWPSFNYILVYVFVINVAGSVWLVWLISGDALSDHTDCVVLNCGLWLLQVWRTSSYFSVVLASPVWVLDLGWHHLSKFPFQITTDLSEESSITAHVLIVS